MSRIGSKNTGPEILLMTEFRKLGYKFELHFSELPGKPDFYFREQNLIVFVNGCFWHRHTGCKFAYTPKSNTDFWNKKFNENRTRDLRISSKLRRLGFHVYVFWECQIKNSELRTRKIQALARKFPPN
ncbi:MAG: DNA mismatch endonuclease Vsr [Leptospiraceae bacterium]|nr:DNA mismatch endonuclease Vsr [Leptospiraceae bacterium]